MKNKNLGQTLKNMLDGFFYMLVHERNMQIHYAIALVVLFIIWRYSFTAIEICLVFLAIGFVISMELINTAIEQTINLCWGEKINPIAKIIKDVASLSVFVAAITAIAIGLFVIVPKLILN